MTNVEVQARERNVVYAHGVNPNNGRRFTLAVVMRKGNSYLGIAECSTKDQFSRKQGRIIAEGRAVHNPTAFIEGENREKALEYIHKVKEWYQKDRAVEAQTFIQLLRSI